MWHGYLPDLRPGLLRISCDVRGSGTRVPSIHRSTGPALRDRRPLSWHPSVFAFAADTEGDGAPTTADSAPYAPLAVVTEDGFDWHLDRRLRICTRR